MPTITGDNGFVADLSDETIDALVAAHPSLAAGVLMVRYLRGAYNRVPAMRQRGRPRCGGDDHARGVPAAEVPRELIDGVHATWKPVLPFTAGTYGNFAQGSARHDIADLSARRR